MPGKLREVKIGSTQFSAEVKRLKAEGKMPSLERLLDVIAETRERFVPKIVAARTGRKKSTENRCLSKAVH
jgi:hypothetical protein